MKILGICGSPRANGNTHILVEEALKGAAGEAETEFVSLADTGDDAIVQLVEKMRQADGIVLGTPSYFGMPSAELKRLLDATWEDARKHRLAGKAGVALTVENVSGGELAAHSLSQFFTAHRMVYLGYVVGRGLKEREVLYDIKAIRDARGLVGRLVDYLEMRS